MAKIYTPVQQRRRRNIALAANNIAKRYAEILKEAEANGLRVVATQYRPTDPFTVLVTDRETNVSVNPTVVPPWID